MNRKQKTWEFLSSRTLKVTNYQKELKSWKTLPTYLVLLTEVSWGN